ncbi:hypothetical protein K493DRAFT_317096 [Basidiobolus meristosporus CBS 931.73]|uniref:PAS domain-containing protein n=1 Tax=Basidiobolus meristosporus CBS 931.73 TaxID=1314790 RepID=A0A1Y1Y150_9FUNG|nr:hypothetical protein K493DRAFT_317096 [Basidiobolus meristosporus CBS 931.73]|eukprot:ORX91730.1 hypothetical protein K493DRAFT_317096 [Basidiobolus meristosporus CBS 931.73]
MVKSSFISISNSTNTEMIYLSRSFEDVLGFSRRNWVGRAPIDLFHPKDREGVSVVIETCIKLQKLATLMYTRIISATVCVNYCCDILVCTNRLLQEKDLPGIFARTSLADNIITVTDNHNINVLGSPEVFHTQVKLGQVLSQTDVGPISLEPEERICLVLDHQKSFQIKYCSSLAVPIFGSTSKELERTSLLNYIDYDDLYDVQEELNEVVKEEAVSNRIDFAFVSLSGHKTELQAIVSYTDDGLILIAKRNPEEVLHTTAKNDIIIC